ncbi:unnamed protein product [Blepharisma stoltei]|uniref:PAS domain-containing protein n=1 Tax=Blepharisma stoltei TaxID=1481888 RepID=A0AAU9JTA8_9CILI|nr:unnamed protein product [Blepharisma stoltei]
MLEMNEEGDEISDHKQKFWKIKEEKSIRDPIFKLYSRLYYKKYYEDNNIVRQKIEFIFRNTVWCLQMISLLWIPDLSIKDWSENMAIWEAIGYFKLDNTCSELGLVNECLLISILSTFIASLAIMILGFLIYRCYNLPDFIFGIVKFCFYLWTSFLIIPSMELLTIFLKYNFTTQEYVTEYNNDHNDIKIYEISAAYQVLIVFTMIINLPLLLFHEAFSGEIRHFISNKNINAKAHSKIDRNIAIFTYFFPVIYVVFAQDYIIYLQILVLFISGLLAIETRMYLPYFSLYSNYIAILRLFIIAFVSFSFILGYLADNSLAISFIAILLGPLLGAFIIRFVPNLLNKANIPDNLTGIISQYDLEKSFRSALCKNDIENKGQIVYMFEAFFIENVLNRGKLQIIWITNYCFYTLKDESLAKIKLSKAKSVFDWGLETNYQEYLCSQDISASCVGENTQFSNYFQKLNVIKKEDKKMCLNSIKFLNEMVSPSPDLKKLKRHLTVVYDKILLLNKEYSQLTAKYPNMRESLSLYASYTRNIIYDVEKSTLLDYKLKSLDKFIVTSITDSKDFSYFNVNNAILMFSTEEENFGYCLFGNEKAAEIFKLPLSEVIGNNVLNFIHPHYRDEVKKVASSYIWYTSSSEINFVEGFFWHAPSAGLLECVGKIVITSMNTLFVGLIVFKLKPVNHQIAWLTENREICCYTDNFPKTMKKTHTNLIGCTISNLFSDLREDLQLFTPYNLSNFEKETAIIMGYYNFYTMKMPYAILTDDNEEIKKWKNEAFGYQSYLESPQDNDSLCLISSMANTFLNCDSQLPEDIYLDSKANLFQPNANEECWSDPNDKESLEKADDDKSNKSEYSFQSRYTDTIRKSSRSTNVLHVAFGFTYLVILSVSSAVLFYAYYNINLISNIDLSIAMGKAGVNFQTIGIISKTLWFLSYFGSTYLPAESAYWKDLNTVLAELEEVSSNLTSNFENWNFCSSRSILSDESIELLYNGDKIYKKKANLLGATTEFIKNINGFSRKLNNSESVWNEVTFLLLNGYGEAFQYCNRSLFNIVECQKSMVDDFKYKIYSLLAMCPAVLVICICLLLPFYYSVVKIENTLWNTLRSRSYANYSELKQNLIERLKNVHSEPEIMAFDQKLSKDPKIFKSLWKYIWRACLLLIIVVIFSLINITYLYDKCADYLYYRPMLIRELINQQMLYTSLDIWSTESSWDSTGYLTAFFFPTMYPFGRSVVKFEDVISKIGNSDKLIKSGYFSSILSKKFWEIYYENNNDYISEFFAFGVYSSKKILEFDGYLTTTATVSMDQWLYMMSISRELNSYYKIIVDEIDDYSKELIDDQITIIIATLAIFIFCLFVLYFGFYLTFFRSEKQYLLKIDSIIKILPQ